MQTGKYPALLHGHGGVPEKRLLLALGTELGCLRRALLADVDRERLQQELRSGGSSGGGSAAAEPLAGLASEEARAAVREGRTSAALPQLLREAGPRYARWAAAAVRRAALTAAAVGAGVPPPPLPPLPPLPLLVRCDELSVVHAEPASTDVEVLLVQELLAG